MNKQTKSLSDLAGRAEHDNEIQMVRSQLFMIAKYAVELYDMLANVPENENLEAWVQSNVAKAASDIDSVYHKLDFKYNSNNGIDFDTDRFSPDRMNRKQDPGMSSRYNNRDFETDLDSDFDSDLDDEFDLDPDLGADLGSLDEPDLNFDPETDPNSDFDPDMELDPMAYPPSRLKPMESVSKKSKSRKRNMYNETQDPYIANLSRRLSQKLKESKSRTAR